MADFKTVQLRPMTGVFDTLSSPDEVGWGNWRLVKNATTRSTRNRQRGGGWRRLFADSTPYNNQDLHDQLTDRLNYYESFSAHASFGGGLAGYNYPYATAAYTIDGAVVFPPASGPYAPVYIGDHPSGRYNGCPIFYPFVGYPYDFIPAFVNATGARAHWKMDTISATTPDFFGGLDLTNFGPSVTSGLIGNALDFSGGDYLGPNGNSAYQMGDIKFGFTGWIYRTDTQALLTKAILDSWGIAGNRCYRLYLNTSEQLVFEVSNNGTASTAVTNTTVIPLNDWAFFACWHDPVANTINIRVNNGATISASHTTGVTTGTGDFAIGYDQATLNANLRARLDSITFWKNAFPTEVELDTIYNSALGLTYPFSTGGANTGLPFYYLYSFIYTSCPVQYPDTDVESYPYGSGSPVYDPVMDYDYTYCGNYMFSRTGCREAVTMLTEVVTSSGRKLVAGTMSRIYELNQSAGNWSVLADGLGNSGYTSEQCGCNKVRGVAATLGSYVVYTNNFDAPLIYSLGSEPSGCGLSAFESIADLAALGITKAGGVVTWKGFTIFYDITEEGERQGGTVLWSDLEDPNSYIESDTSFAGRATIAVGETILAAAPLGNWLIIYTDKSIIRVTLVGGEDVFNFERIYQGGNALKFKFSLVNCGDQHLYLGESDVYVFTQFDTRPIAVAWITRASGIIFNGLEEDDATYSPINRDACDLVTGGWSEEKQEAWLSWPTGESVCPDATIRYNFKFNAADFVDHGFTAFLTFRQDNRPTVGQWIENLGICPRGSKVAVGIKDGEVCSGTESAVSNPPLYIRNPTEDPDLPVHSNSLCARLSGQTIEDYCRDCPVQSTFITASADDFTLKQQEDDIYYREMLGGTVYNYDGSSCQGQYYQHEGYDTVMQEGANNYKTDDEKMIKMIGIEAEPIAQAIPSDLECDIGYAATPSCFTWSSIRSLPFACQTSRTASEHIARRTRPDGVFYYPCWRRGVYLSIRFRISGIGGGGKFSAISRMIKGWGQQDSP